MDLEQARTALQSNDTQSAMMYLDMALSAMGGGGGGTQGNITVGTAGGGGNATTGGEEGVSVGGTSRLTTMIRQQTPMDRIIEYVSKKHQHKPERSGKELSCPALLKAMNPEYNRRKMSICSIGNERVFFHPSSFFYHISTTSTLFSALID